MSSVVIQGDTSGSVTIQAPAISGTTIINLPTVTGGNFVVSDSSGNVGIGTNTPRGKLDITTVNGYGTNDSIVFGSGTITYPSANQYSGTASIVSKGPTSDGRLMVQDGNGRLNNYWNAYTDTGGYKYIVSGEPAGRHLMSVSGTAGVDLGWYSAPAGTAGGSLSWTQIARMVGGTGGFTWLSPRGTSSDFYIDAVSNVMVGYTSTTSTSSNSLLVAGKVGIGTNAPTSQLSVVTTLGGSTGNYYDPTNYAAYIHNNNNSVSHYGLLVSDYWRSSENFVFAVDGRYYQDGTIANDLHNPYFIVRGDGNVGIGTSLPVNKLDVTGVPGTNGDARSLISIADNSSFAAGVGGGITFRAKYNTAGTYYDAAGIKGIKENATDGNSGGALVFSTNPSGLTHTERMRIDSSGRVGINVTPSTSTTAQLQVTGGTTNATTLLTSYSQATVALVPKSSSGYSLAIASGTGDNPQIQVSANGTAAGDLLIQPYGGFTYINTLRLRGSDTYQIYESASTTNLQFGTNGAAAFVFSAVGVGERMRIDSAGNLQIASTGTLANLFLGMSAIPGSMGNAFLYANTGVVVTSNGAANPYYQWYNTQSATDKKTWRVGTQSGGNLIFETVNDAYTAATARMNIDASGNVSIATTSSTTKFYVAGSAASNNATLTDGATITPDFTQSNNFSVTLGGNRTMANPTGLTVGQSGVIFITQDATGSRTLAWGTSWDWANAGVPVLTTAANAIDVVAYTVRTATSIVAQIIQNIG